MYGSMSHGMADEDKKREMKIAALKELHKHMLNRMADDGKSEDHAKAEMLSNPLHRDAMMHADAGKEPEEGSDEEEALESPEEEASEDEGGEEDEKSMGKGDVKNFFSKTGKKPMSKRPSLSVMLAVGAKPAKRGMK